MSKNTLMPNILLNNLSNAACHQCDKRNIGCHSRCSEYKKWYFTHKIIALLQQSQIQTNRKISMPKKYYITTFKNNKISLSF